MAGIERELRDSFSCNGGLTMKILALEIQGYRSLHNIKWQPDNLNVVIGPNGTGKSNLLHLLEMISISAQGRLSKYIQSLGGMEPLIWDGSETQISFRLKTTPVKETAIDALTYFLELVRLGKEVPIK